VKVPQGSTAHKEQHMTNPTQAIKFEVTPEWASLAIIECANAVIKYAPEPGARLVFAQGNGYWSKRGTSNYFDSGSNRVENTPTGPGDVGTLGAEHMQKLEQWFTDKYQNYQPTVLSAGQKRNFTLVSGTSALNFHLEIR
jgi:hypothetical protein